MLLTTRWTPRVEWCSKSIFSPQGWLEGLYQTLGGRRFFLSILTNSVERQNFVLKLPSSCFARPFPVCGSKNLFYLCDALSCSQYHRRFCFWGPLLYEVECFPTFLVLGCKFYFRLNETQGDLYYSKKYGCCQKKIGGHFPLGSIWMSIFRQRIENCYLVLFNSVVWVVLGLQLGNQLRFRLEFATLMQPAPSFWGHNL
jgi:hypothetical protein